MVNSGPIIRGMEKDFINYLQQYPFKINELPYVQKNIICWHAPCRLRRALNNLG
jgi:hypothetical protein